MLDPNGQYDPSAQAMIALPPLQYDPRVQVAHASDSIAPSDKPNVPATHVVQADEPAEEDQLPAAHTVH